MRTKIVSLKKVINCGNPRWVVDRTENGKRKRSFFVTRAAAEAEVSRIGAQVRDTGAVFVSLQEANRLDPIENQERKRRLAEVAESMASEPRGSIDLDRPMHPKQFAEWIGRSPDWVYRHLHQLPGVVRHSKKCVHIIPRYYVEAAARVQPHLRNPNDAKA